MAKAKKPARKAAKKTTAPLHVVLTTEQHSAFKALAKSEHMTLGELLLRMFNTYEPVEFDATRVATFDERLTSIETRLFAIEGGVGVAPAGEFEPANGAYPAPHVVPENPDAPRFGDA